MSLYECIHLRALYVPSSHDKKKRVFSTHSALSAFRLSLSLRRGLFYIFYFMNPYIETIKRERRVVVRLLAELPKSHDAETCFINSFVDVKETGVLKSPFFMQLRSLFQRPDPFEE